MRDDDPKLEAALKVIAAGLRRAAAEVQRGREHDDAFEELWDGDTDARAAAYDYVCAARPRGRNVDEGGPRSPRRSGKARSVRVDLADAVRKLTR